jgi:hypothetical protein
MALLAESLVEEWLNRNRFFTIRGIKHGLAEIDLLAIRHEADTSVTGWHVEVQVSFRPVGYIAKLSGDMARALNRARTDASARTPDQIETCASAWVQSKFKADAKARPAKDSGRKCSGSTISSMPESASPGSLRCFKGRE